MASRRIVIGQSWSAGSLVSISSSQYHDTLFTGRVIAGSPTKLSNYRPVRHVTCAVPNKGNSLLTSSMKNRISFNWIQLSDEYFD